MNQIRNRDFFSFFSVHPALPAKSAFSKIAGFFYQNFFSLHSLSLCSRSLQKEPTGENSAIFEQFSSPPRRPLWKKERPFPLPIVPRAIIASFFFYWNTQQELLRRTEEQLFLFMKIVTLQSV